MFDTPGEYEVRLIVSTGGLECFDDTTVKVISMIQSPEVGFTVDRDTVWSPRHKYDEQGTYLMKLKSDNGCGWDMISSPVIIYPLPYLEIKSEDYLCEADTFTFVVNSDQKLKQVIWKLGDGQTRNKDCLRKCTKDTIPSR